jgi:hypothetical protein
MLFFSRVTVTVRGEHGMRFCRPGTNCLAYTSIAVQIGLVQVIYQGVETKKKPLVGAPYVEPARLVREDLSWC